MNKVYISSTYKDLTAYRAAATTALRKMRCDVIRMEEYVARDQRTRAACEADVAACDIYVGIFAWRYGHIPTDNNPDRKSITELEYRRALLDKACLVFLLSDEAPWPSTMRDAETGENDRGERIRTFRAELKERSPAYFSTADQLANEVFTAVYQHESTRRVERLNVINEIKQSTGIGPSYLQNIQQKIVEARDAEIVEISLGPIPWWTTRLHLVAALASDFTKIRQFVFLDADGRWVSMAAPSEVRRALTRRFPQLEQAYQASRPEPGRVGATQEIDQIMMTYAQKIFHAFGDRREQDVTENVSPIMLRNLGIEASAEAIEEVSVPSTLRQWEIIRRPTPFVVLLKQARVVSVIDRVQMVSNIATQALQERLG